MTNIYIQLEVKLRELEGRLLLALAAAERGHDVLLGKVATPATAGKLAPGIFHTKSLTPGPRKLATHRKLRANGFEITSQDEEHGLLDADYSAFARARFSDESISLVAKVFCWGPHDLAYLRKNHTEYSDRFVETGSPRVDFWRNEFDGFFQGALDWGTLAPFSQYVLIPSNFGKMLNFRRFWDVVDSMRPTYFDGEDDEKEFRLYESVAYHTRLTGHFVRAIRRLSNAFPDVLFVVRPHPVEAEGAWEKLLGPRHNVVVRRDGGIGKWIRHASLIVQNGCTSALEAAAAGVPVVAYRPEPDSRFEREIPNSVGAQAHDLDELMALVGRGIRKQEEKAHLGKDRQVLARRFASLDGPLAADRIVDAWGDVEIANGSGDKDHSIGGTYMIKQRGRSMLHMAAGRISRQTNPASDLVSHKFAPFTRTEIEACVQRIGAALNRFEDIQAKLVNPRLCQIRARR